MMLSASDNVLRQTFTTHPTGMFYHHDHIRFQHYLSRLDLEKGATFDDVKIAYRTLVKQWHPDRFAQEAHRLAEAEERMKQINEAYEWLAANRYVFEVDWDETAGAHADAVAGHSNSVQSIPVQEQGANRKSGISFLGIAWLFLVVVNSLNYAMADVNSELSVAPPVIIAASLFILMMVFLIRGLFLKDE